MTPRVRPLVERLVAGGWVAPLRSDLDDINASAVALDYLLDGDVDQTLAEFAVWLTRFGRFPQPAFVREPKTRSVVFPRISADHAAWPVHVGYFWRWGDPGYSRYGEWVTLLHVPDHLPPLLGSLLVSQGEPANPAAGSRVATYPTPEDAYEALTAAWLAGGKSLDPVWSGPVAGLGVQTDAGSWEGMSLPVKGLHFAHALRFDPAQSSNLRALQVAAAGAAGLP